MLGQKASAAWAVAVLMFLAPTVLADDTGAVQNTNNAKGSPKNPEIKNESKIEKLEKGKAKKLKKINPLKGKVIPCAIGSGTQNGCSYCQNGTAFEVGDWNNVTRTGQFSFPDAAVQGGAGYDVYWNIPQPDPGCRIIITTLERGIYDSSSVQAGVSGTTILATNQAGCYYGHVSSAGAGIGKCCNNEDCVAAGAIAPLTTSKRLAPSRIMRGEAIEHLEQQDQMERRQHAGSVGQTICAATTKKKRGTPIERSWGGHQDPAPAAPSAPAFSCTPAQNVGEPYTRPGLQQIRGTALQCNSGEICDLEFSGTFSASTSVMNEQSTSVSTSVGDNWSLSVGVFDFVTANAEAGCSKEVSNAVSTATSTTDTTDHSWTSTMLFGIKPGQSGQLSWTPTMVCQNMTTVCGASKTTLQLQSCAPEIDKGDSGNGGTHSYVGTYGILTVP